MDPHHRTATSPQASAGPAAPISSTDRTRWITQPLSPTGEGLAALALRVALGIVMFPHGAQKALGWFGGAGLSATIDNFAQHFGLPAVVTLLIVAAELLGSLALLVGLWTRFAAFGIAAVMVGAVVMVHWQHGLFMDWQNQKGSEGFEYHLLAIGAALALMAIGGGRWSIDRWLRERRRERTVRA